MASGMGGVVAPPAHRDVPDLVTNADDNTDIHDNTASPPPEPIVLGLRLNSPRKL